MLSYIAISAEIELFQNERVLEPEWAGKFPGALWMAQLALRLLKRNIKVTTGDVALSNVKQGLWQASEIGIIQHLDDPITERLISLGSEPLIITTLESPLYVPFFYKNASKIVAKFHHKVLFSGVFEDMFKDGSCHFMRFPSYQHKDIVTITPWNNRNFLTMVVSNKYEALFSPIYLRYLSDSLKLVKRFVSVILHNRNMKRFASYIESYKNQLQDKRLSAIIFFGINNSLQLFGKGWNNLNNLPLFYKKKLTPLLENLNPQLCEDKIQTIKDYKFALCFENFSYPGYITEKIIECFVAGVIPVYIGAPNIAEFIPKDSFIDVRKYESLDMLLTSLRTMNAMEAEKMIETGRAFLSTNHGNLHSYEGFTKFIEQLLSPYISA